MAYVVAFLLIILLGALRSPDDHPNSHQVG